MELSLAIGSVHNLVEQLAPGQSTKTSKEHFQATLAGILELLVRGEAKRPPEQALKQLKLPIKGLNATGDQEIPLDPKELLQAVLAVPIGMSPLETVELVPAKEGEGVAIEPIGVGDQVSVQSAKEAMVQPRSFVHGPEMLSDLPVAFTAPSEERVRNSQAPKMPLAGAEDSALETFPTVDPRGTELELDRVQSVGEEEVSLLFPDSVGEGSRETTVQRPPLTQEVEGSVPGMVPKETPLEGPQGMPVPKSSQSPDLLRSRGMVQQGTILDQKTEWESGSLWQALGERLVVEVAPGPRKFTLPAERPRRNHWVPGELRSSQPSEPRELGIRVNPQPHRPLGQATIPEVEAFSPSEVASPEETPRVQRPVDLSVFPEQVLERELLVSTVSRDRETFNPVVGGQREDTRPREVGERVLVQEPATVVFEVVPSPKTPEIPLMMLGSRDLSPVEDLTRQEEDIAHGEPLVFVEEEQGQPQPVRMKTPVLVETSSGIEAPRGGSQRVDTVHSEDTPEQNGHVLEMGRSRFLPEALEGVAFIEETSFAEEISSPELAKVQIAEPEGQRVREEGPWWIVREPSPEPAPRAVSNPVATPQGDRGFEPTLDVPPQAPAQVLDRAISRGPLEEGTQPLSGPATEQPREDASDQRTAPASAQVPQPEQFTDRVIPEQRVVEPMGQANTTQLVVTEVEPKAAERIVAHGSREQPFSGERPNSRLIGGTEAREAPVEDVSVVTFLDQNPAAREETGDHRRDETPLGARPEVVRRSEPVLQEPAYGTEALQSPGSRTPAVSLEGALEKASGEPGNFPVEELVEEIVQAAQLVSAGEERTFHLKLATDKAEIKVVLSLANDRISGRFVVEEAALLQVLEERLPKLRESLTRAGVDLASFDAFLHQEQGQQHRQSFSAEPWPTFGLAVVVPQVQHRKPTRQLVGTSINLLA